MVGNNFGDWMRRPDVGGRRIAVAVRTHRTTAKLEAMLRSLSGSKLYDLYLAANETRNEVKDFGATKLVHTADIMSPLGEAYGNETALVNCSDMVFASLRQALPEYSFIIVVEDDVHFPFGARNFLERVVEAVSCYPGNLDLLATKLRQAERNWWWYEEGRRLFADVRAMLFSFVGMSARAIDHVRLARQDEAARAGGSKLVFCEAFVPSVLAGAPDFRSEDINTLLPNSYRDETFTIGLPFLFEDFDAQAAGVQMAHPVYSAGEFLDRRFAHARSPGGNVRAFLHDLEVRHAAIPASLRTEYAARGSVVLLSNIMDQLDRLERTIRRE